MRRVLLVDDEEFLLKSLVEMLKRSGKLAGVEFVTAQNGREALAILDAGGADLVVTDLKMPEMDGMELLQEMGESHGDLPVIVISAYGSEDVEVEVKRRGAVRYLDKPLDTGELARQIEGCLEASAQGFINGIPLADFMQTVQLGRKSCSLEVLSARGTGWLYFWEGELVDAGMEGAADSREAALEIAGWEDVSIRIAGNFGAGKTWFR